MDIRPAFIRELDKASANDHSAPYDLAFWDRDSESAESEDFDA